MKPPGAMMAPMRLLVVEDDRQLGPLLVRALREEGHAVDLAVAAVDADHAVRTVPYDLVVLDLGLPDGDGVALCDRWRRESLPVAVLMLTARDATGDKVAGLDAGADDYLTKPFDLAELCARVRAVLRRPTGARHVVLRAGDVEVDVAARVVRRAGMTIPLTAREFAVLHYLLTRPGEVVSRSDLYDHVWDGDYDGLSNTVDVHVGNLRRKLDRAGRPSLIETVRGAGYRLAG
ncbi:MAG: response regulator transcription factor [Acidimicrobiales bacterium]